MRDVVRAYLLLMERGRAGEAYNVGSGQTCSMQEVLDRLLAVAGRDGRGAAATGPGARPPTRPPSAADAGKLRRETGWAPAISLEQTLRDTLEYWQRQIGSQPPVSLQRGDAS